jgi:rod shape-determining protein MreB and related proteins
MIFDLMFGWFSHDMAVDLGTANTLVYVKGEGIVLREPSIVAVQKGTDHVIKVGSEAKAMLGRTPGNIVAIRPMQDGVIADFDITEKMLKHFIKMVHKSRGLAKPRIVISVPSGVTEVEKRAVRDSAAHAGAREVYLIEEPMAAAIGVGLPIAEPTGNMIVDMGGGTTEVAVISLGGIVHSRSVRVGGQKLDEAIVNYIKRAYNVLIGERTAEEIKIYMGSAYPLKEEMKMEIKGRDLVTGLPRMMEITSEEIRSSLEEPLVQIIDAVKMTLEKTPPELSADIVERGIVLAGGTSLLKNLDLRLREETGVPVNVAEDPLVAVVMGAGRVLDESIEDLKKIVLPEKEYF